MKRDRLLDQEAADSHAWAFRFNFDHFVRREERKIAWLCVGLAVGLIAVCFLAAWVGA